MGEQAFREWLVRLSKGQVGFRIDESMEGTHRFLRDFSPAGIPQGSEFPFAFSATWGHDYLLRFLNPLSRDFLRAPLTGSVTAGGLCFEAPISGELELRYFRDATIRYSFEFRAYDIPWRYCGEKREIRPWNLHRTHTRCFGTITNLSTAEVLSEAAVAFPLEQLPRWLASFRLV